MPIIRIAHEAADLKVLAAPLTCPMRWSIEAATVIHGNTQASRPGLTHVSRVAEET
jgi:hypothetical protein